MRAAAIVLACSLVACDDGVIRLSSGELGPDATAPGVDASTTLEASTGGSVDGSGPDGAAPSQGDAGHGCASDTDCPIASLHCNTATGACVECTSDKQCTKPGFPRCDLATNRCVPCAVNSDCADGGVCSSATLHCVIPCRDGGGCPIDDMTCGSNGYCAACDSTKDGGGCSGASVCDDDNGQCAECTVDSQCPSAKPHCDSQTDSCVQCVLSSQCPPSTPVCDPSNWTCVP